MEKSISFEKPTFRPLPVATPQKDERNTKNKKETPKKLQKCTLGYKLRPSGPDPHYSAQAAFQDASLALAHGEAGSWTGPGVAGSWVGPHLRAVAVDGFGRVCRRPRPNPILPAAPRAQALLVPARAEYYYYTW